MSIFAVALLLLLLASAAQASLAYIDRARMRHMVEEGAPRAQALARMLEDPTETLSTVILVHTAALVAAAAAGFWLVLVWYPAVPAAAVGIGLAAFLAVLLVQILGRLLAVSRPEGVALALVRPVGLLSKLLLPLVLLFATLERWGARALGAKYPITPAEAEDRLRHLVEDHGDLEEDEREMIAAVIELGEQPVREVMVPRIDIRAQPDTATVGDLVDTIVQTGHSRIPVFGESIDNITGVVYAKDVLKYLRTGGQADPVAPLARQPYYVPETKKVDDLLHEMQLRHVHLAIVVDEYGGTAGLITIEDLIEEIVGEIQDEFDVEEAPIVKISETEALFNARVSIRDVNDTLDVEIDDEHFDTLGGLLYHELGRVPTVGEEVEADGVRVVVLSTVGRRVKQVRVTKVPVEEHVVTARA